MTEPETYTAHNGQEYPWPPPTWLTFDEATGRWGPSNEGPTLIADAVPHVPGLTEWVARARGEGDRQ